MSVVESEQGCGEPAGGTSASTAVPGPGCWGFQRPPGASTAAAGDVQSEESPVELSAAPPVAREFPKLPEQVRLFVGVITYSEMVHADVLGWTGSLYHRLAGHPRLADNGVGVGKIVGYPTDRARNLCCKTAKDNGYHFALMLDDDMCPDLGLSNTVHRDSSAVPFLPGALDFALDHDDRYGKPCVVGAPYCGGPPEQRVMVMRWREKVPDSPPDQAGVSIESYTREEEAQESGFVRVAGLPTGCLLVDLRALDVIPPPWFSYEWADPPFNTQLASTEDIVFTRNAHWMGIPQFAAMSSWAGHWKRYLTGKPKAAPLDTLPRSLHRAVLSGLWRSTCED